MAASSKMTNRDKSKLDQLATATEESQCQSHGLASRATGKSRGEQKPRSRPDHGREIPRQLTRTFGYGYGLHLMCLLVPKDYGYFAEIDTSKPTRTEQAVGGDHTRRSSREAATRTFGAATGRQPICLSVPKDQQEMESRGHHQGLQKQAHPS